MLVPWCSYEMTTLIRHVITIVLLAWWRSSVIVVEVSVLSAAIRHDGSTQVGYDVLSSQY